MVLTNGRLFSNSDINAVSSLGISLCSGNSLLPSVIEEKVKYVGPWIYIRFMDLSSSSLILFFLCRREQPKGWPLWVTTRKAFPATSRQPILVESAVGWINSQILQCKLCHWSQSSVTFQMNVWNVTKNIPKEVHWARRSTHTYYLQSIFKPIILLPWAAILFTAAPSL